MCKTHETMSSNIWDWVAPLLRLKIGFHLNLFMCHLFQEIIDETQPEDAPANRTEVAEEATEN